MNHLVILKLSRLLLVIPAIDLFSLFLFCCFRSCFTAAIYPKNTPIYPKNIMQSLNYIWVYSPYEFAGDQDYNVLGFSDDVAKTLV